MRSVCICVSVECTYAQGVHVYVKFVFVFSVYACMPVCSVSVRSFVCLSVSVCHTFSIGAVTSYHHNFSDLFVGTITFCFYILASMCRFA